MYLHKIGKYEIPADEILTALQLDHIHYEVSKMNEIMSYLTEERRESGTESVGGDKIVNSKLFTSENLAMVTFEEFKIFCEFYGMNAYKEAEKINRKSFWRCRLRIIFK